MRAYAILGLALLNAEENLFDKDKVQQVIYREWNSNVKYRFYISDAADDFNNKFGWNIELS